MTTNGGSGLALDSNGKVLLSHVYNRDDPRYYFKTLVEALDYKIADFTQPVIKNLLPILGQNRPHKRLKLVDLACSYGITGRLLRSGLTMSELCTHYQRHSDCSRENLIAFDRASASKPPEVTIIGLDIAENACAYALESQSVDATIVANLENCDLSEEQSQLLADADLIVSSGFFSYGGVSTVTRIVNAATDRQPWMAHFVMRPFDYTPVRQELARCGYVTAQGARPVMQRRFASDLERDKLVSRLIEDGIDPTGYEDAHGIHAELYVSRPTSERDKINAETLQNILQIEEHRSINNNSWQAQVQ